jgi:hypothetical protein
MVPIWLVLSLFPASDEFLTPAESLAKTRLAAGLAVELAAAEPNVESPVAISFDERGRMFVAEYRRLPARSQAGRAAPVAHPAARRPRRRRLFRDFDGLRRPIELRASGAGATRGVIVTAAPHVLFLKDTNGDGTADERRVLFTGFKAGTRNFASRTHGSASTTSSTSPTASPGAKSITPPRRGPSSPWAATTSASIPGP